MRRTYHRENIGKRTALLALLGLLAAGLLDGCGDEAQEAVSAGAQTQENAEEDGGDDGTPAEEDGGDDGTPAEDAAADQDAQRQAEADEGQLDMDEETRLLLTAELLEENEMDTSVMEIERATRGCVFGLPKGFRESEETPGLYVTDRYPLDASMIYYEVMDRDISLQLLTAELFEEQAEADLSEVYGEDIEVNVEISGYPAFRILCSYEAEGLAVTQLEYAINADKSYMITYTQTGEYDRMEEYKASAATIKVR